MWEGCGISCFKNWELELDLGVELCFDIGQVIWEPRVLFCLVRYDDWFLEFGV